MIKDELSLNSYLRKLTLSCLVSRGLIKSLELVNYFEKPKSMEDTETKLVFKVEIIDLRKWSKYWFKMICFFVKTIDLFNSHLWVLGRGRKKRGEIEEVKAREVVFLSLKPVIYGFDWAYSNWLLFFFSFKFLVDRRIKSFWKLKEN